MNISDAGLHLIEEFEGFVDHKYQDSVGVWTIGFGTTLGAGVVDPLPDTCTVAQAQEWLALYVERSIEPMLNAATVAHPLNQNQYDALCSFGYNLGPGYFGPQHSVGQSLRAGNWAGVANDVLQFDMAGGVRLQGLANRREAEVKLFNTPVAKPQPTAAQIAAAAKAKALAAAKAAEAKAAAYATWLKEQAFKLAGRPRP
jgi:lysozyme